MPHITQEYLNTLEQILNETKKIIETWTDLEKSIQLNRLTWYCEGLIYINK